MDFAQSIYVFEKFTTAALKIQKFRLWTEG